MPKENILIIDDEAVILSASSEILKRADYRVAVARDANEGYERLKQEPFELIITDIKMPGMSGIELIKKIRHEVSIDLPIMVITGHGTIDIAIESLRYGAMGFVMKPFTPMEFLDSVKDVLRKSGIIKENLKLKTLIPIFEVNKRLLSELNIERLFQIIVEEAVKHTGSERTSLMLVEGDKTLRMKTSMGMEISDKERPVNHVPRAEARGSLKQEIFDTPLHPRSEERMKGSWVKVRFGEGIAGLVAERMEPILLDGRQEHPCLKDAIKKDGISSALSVPIISKGTLLGVMNLTKIADAKPFTNSDMEVISILCGQAAIAIENARLYQRLEDSYVGIIATLASTIEARDPYTAGHANRMAEYSCSTAEELGVSDADREIIKRAALLHDIGKIGIPDHILLKTTRLLKDEFQVMKEHPEIGGRILDNMSGFDDVAVIVRYHHARFDGNGYPGGLIGKDIPLGARIITVTDAFEAMTSVRPYRKAIPPNEAVEEIRKMEGTQFDPDVVEAFIRVLTRNEMI